MIVFMFHYFVEGVLHVCASKPAQKYQKAAQIDVERDRRRYIINIWWKSILDGLKSTVLGDKNKRAKTEKSKKG